MSAVSDLGDYCFAYTAITEADLTGAVNVGMEVFLKEKLTPFTVTLGDKLEKMGDNPFAFCQIKPFVSTEIATVNGKEKEIPTHNYAISDAVQVINGSLYCKVPNGLELVTYTGLDAENMKVAEDTVRITAMAFAGSDVEMVTLPATTFAIGHKAFFSCDKLHTVVLGSQQAPILEEEYDPAYYESFEHMPATGDLGTYQDWEGNDVQIYGMGLIPYYMWNSTDGLYYNVFYGASFVDYVGYVENKLTLVRPVNGTNYDSYIYGQYFDLDVVIDGAHAPNKDTLKTIAAIKAIPERVTYEQRNLVEYARSLYGKIATLEQQALVSNYADLITAEQRILSLTPTDEAPVEEQPTEEKDSGMGWLIVLLVILGVILLAGVAAVVYSLLIAKKQERPMKDVLLETWNWVKTMAVKIAKIVADFCVKAAKTIAAWAVKAYKVTAPACAKAWESAANWFNKTIAAIKEKAARPQNEEAQQEEMTVSEPAAEDAAVSESEAEEIQDEENMQEEPVEPAQDEQ